MPEYPDLSVYLECLEPRVLNRGLNKVRLGSPFVLRTVEPPLAACEGLKVRRLSRIGKRLVLSLERDLHLVIHLMIAGRLQWKDETGAKLPGRAGLCAFDFETGTLTLTEVSTKKRASLSVVRGADGLAAMNRGGIEPLQCTLAQFSEALRRENHTLKRSMTDPRFFAAIGNAYSDEILHHARLSPIKQTKTLTDDEIKRLFESTRVVLTQWAERLSAEVQGGKGWPQKVTAFRPEMAVHGKYKSPCPDCGSPVQRIVHAENETNYCARCQNQGRLLADRSLSRLLKEDWPKTLDELEEYKSSRSK